MAPVIALHPHFLYRETKLKTSNASDMSSQERYDYYSSKDYTKKEDKYNKKPAHVEINNKLKDSKLKPISTSWTPTQSIQNKSNKLYVASTIKRVFRDDVVKPCKDNVNKDIRIEKSNNESETNDREVLPLSPCEWSEHTSKSGRKYYFNIRTEISQWEKPQILIERESLLKMRTAKMLWTMKRTLEGNHDFKTKETVSIRQNKMLKTKSDFSSTHIPSHGLHPLKNPTLIQSHQSTEKVLTAQSSVPSFDSKNSPEEITNSSPNSMVTINLQKALHNLHQAIMHSQKSKPTQSQSRLDPSPNIVSSSSPHAAESFSSGNDFDSIGDLEESFVSPGHTQNAASETPLSRMGRKLSREHHRNSLDNERCPGRLLKAPNKEDRKFNNRHSTTSVTDDNSTLPNGRLGGVEGNFHYTHNNNYLNNTNEGTAVNGCAFSDTPSLYSDDNSKLSEINPKISSINSGSLSVTTLSNASSEICYSKDIKLRLCESSTNKNGIPIYVMVTGGPVSTPSALIHNPLLYAQGIQSQNDKTSVNKQFGIFPENPVSKYLNHEQPDHNLMPLTSGLVNVSPLKMNGLSHQLTPPRTYYSLYTPVASLKNFSSDYLKHPKSDTNSSINSSHTLYFETENYYCKKVQRYLLDDTASDINHPLIDRLLPHSSGDQLSLAPALYDHQTVESYVRWDSVELEKKANLLFIENLENFQPQYLKSEVECHVCIMSHIAYNVEVLFLDDKLLALQDHSHNVNELKMENNLLPPSVHNTI